MAEGLRPSAIDRLLRNGTWVTRRPGVYDIQGGEGTWIRRLMAAILFRPGSLASHGAAGAVWELDGCKPGPLEIILPKPPGKSPGITVHKGSVVPMDRARFRDVPVTSVALTLLHLGAVLDERNFELALEDALRRGLVSLARLRWYVENVGGRGMRGTAPLRRLLEARPAGTVATDSALEVKTERFLRETSLPPPVRQHRVVEQGRQLISLGWTVFIVTDHDLRHDRPRLKQELEETYRRLEGRG